MPEDFLVTLYTGSRWGAGTKADIFLQLISQNGTSDVHCLWHPQVPSFHQGSTDRFLLTTREGLGDICAFGIWHNNRDLVIYVQEVTFSQQGRWLTGKDIFRHKPQRSPTQKGLLFDPSLQSSERGPSVDLNFCSLSHQHFHQAPKVILLGSNVITEVAL
uniref:PLAT domain-containing protein n=1 Tax=Anser cygnoides TaxID=8845 RepID=A0A8B9EFC7_ANSCY